MIEVNSNENSEGKIKKEIAHMLQSRLGIAIGVELVSKGATADLTQIDTRQKAIRLIDERF